ncbi:MAG: hypothetical protein GY913_28165 [Proteobacteria bacterium]|nr:hypothetical protein [Pseudomonadota bacterium]MCP4920787.1 hypothetical protein [Pseudomonadota bacterium]
MKDAIALLRRRETGRFDFTHRDIALSDVDELLVGAGLRFPTFRMIRDGKGCSIDAICTDDLVRPQQVYSHLRDGWTLVLDQLHRQWGPIGKLNRRFETALAARCRVDVLVVPDGATPPAHPHLERVLLCLAGDAGVRVDGTEHRLAEGQALVLPRGTVMEPLPAVGLTLVAVASIDRVTWREVLIAALEAADAPAWHDAIDLDAAGPKTLSESEQATWDQCVEAVQDKLDAEDALEAIASRIVRSRMPVLRGQLEMQKRPIDDNTPLRRRPEILYRIVEDETHTNLEFHTHAVQFGVGARNVLELIAEAPLFRPGDLPGIPVEQRVPLCAALIRYGFLTLDVTR